jgi:hypothetical protein
VQATGVPVMIERVEARLDSTDRILVLFSPMRDEDAYEEAKAMSRYVPGRTRARSTPAARCGASGATC